MNESLDATLHVNEPLLPIENLREKNLLIHKGEVSVVYDDGEQIKLGNVAELDSNGWENGVRLIVPTVNERVYPLSRREALATPYLSVEAGPVWDEEIELKLTDGIVVNGQSVEVKEFLGTPTDGRYEEKRYTFTEFAQLIDSIQ